jgi:geranylgeranyl pyrophosphate synthase
VAQADYLEMIRRKTGSMFALSAVLANGREFAHAGELSEFGCLLGTAFQIADDCLDLRGDPEVVGKDLRLDIKNGQYGLPVLLARDSGRFADVQSAIDRQDHEALAVVLEEVDAIEKAKAIASDLCERAFAIVRPLLSEKTAAAAWTFAKFLCERSS